jgi:acetolactate synthase regulatory subunit
MRAPEIRSMSLTESDFFRILPYALQGRDFSICQDGVEIRVDAEIIRISLIPQSPHTIAGLSMPVLKVGIDFGNLPDSAAQAFMQRFNLAFHRGGG